MPKSRGFTLVELLVTITIIAVLAAIGLVTYSIALKQGRDSKRQSDLRSIQSALEQYYSDQGFYPFAQGGGLDDRLYGNPPPSFTSATGNPSPPPTTKTYLNSLPQDPVDPIGARRYSYEARPATPCDNTTTTTQCTSYCLYAWLENLPSPPPSPPSGCAYPPGRNFAVTPP